MTIEGPAGGRGKWSMPGVPHRGWVCVNIEDLGEPSSHCEMCETQEIRFVHYMEHPNYPDGLACGCICAGHMEGDLGAAERRDKKMRSSASKRRSFPSRAGWRINEKGNHLLKTDGYRITVFHKGNVWGAVVSSASDDTSRFARGKFTSIDDAKRAAFDTLTFLKESRPKLRTLEDLLR